MHRRPISQILFPGEDIDPQTTCSMCGDFTIASIIPILSFISSMGGAWFEIYEAVLRKTVNYAVLYPNDQPREGVYSRTTCMCVCMCASVSRNRVRPAGWGMCVISLAVGFLASGIRASCGVNGSARMTQGTHAHVSLEHAALVISESRRRSTARLCQPHVTLHPRIRIIIIIVSSYSKTRGWVEGV